MAGCLIPFRTGPPLFLTLLPGLTPRPLGFLTIAVLSICVPLLFSTVIPGGKPLPNPTMPPLPPLDLLGLLVAPLPLAVPLNLNPSSGNLS